MGNVNSDVENGIANGTTCTFQSAKRKPGPKLQPIQMYDKWVYAVSIDDVDHWNCSGRILLDLKEGSVSFPKLRLEKRFGSNPKFG